MSAAPAPSTTLDELFVEDYYRTFTDFVRHMQGQGFPLSDRVMDAAHDRAKDQAIKQARARGYRSVDFTPYVNAGLARARARYGF